MFCSSRIFLSVKFTTVTSPMSSTSRRRRRGCEDIRWTPSNASDPSKVLVTCSQIGQQVGVLDQILHVRVSTIDVKLFPELTARITVGCGGRWRFLQAKMRRSCRRGPGRRLTIKEDAVRRLADAPTRCSFEETTW